MNEKRKTYKKKQDELYCIKCETNDEHREKGKQFFGDRIIRFFDESKFVSGIYQREMKLQKAIASYTH